MMIKIRTRPINTRPARASTAFVPSSGRGELSRMSSMRAALNSKYCMRAQLRAKGHLGWCAKHSSEVEELASGFAYQEGQHRARPNGQREKTNGNGKLRLPEEVKITKTANGKRWSTSSMEVELAKDILEVRDGLDKIVDALLLKPKV